MDLLNIGDPLVHILEYLDLKALYNLKRSCRYFDQELIYNKRRTLFDGVLMIRKSYKYKSDTCFTMSTIKDLSDNNYHPSGHSQFKYKVLTYRNNICVYIRKKLYYNNVNTDPNYSKFWIIKCGIRDYYVAGLPLPKSDAKPIFVKVCYSNSSIIEHCIHIIVEYTTYQTINHPRVDIQHDPSFKECFIDKINGGYLKHNDPKIMTNINDWKSSLSQ